jgi:hypothetical protein
LAVVPTIQLLQSTKPAWQKLESNFLHSKALAALELQEVVQLELQLVVHHVPVQLSQ